MRLNTGNPQTIDKLLIQGYIYNKNVGNNIVGNKGGYMERLKQAYGNWVEDDRFWDREKDIESLIEKIDAGAHILLVSQRRMGKTSLMRETARRLKAKYITLFIDLQGASRAADAVVELSLALKPHQSLWIRAKDVFSNTMGRLADSIEKISVGELGIAFRSALTSGNWMDKANQLLLIIASSEKPVLLLMDEVPLMVNRMLKGDDFKITPERRGVVDEFMSWLRRNSLQYQGKINIVISGSIGFEPVLHQAGLSATINNFISFELAPWDEHTAISCLEALAAEYGLVFKDGAASAMARRLGCCIPHHVQMFFTQAYERCKRRERMEFFADEVNDIYEMEMLGIRGHTELTHYEERLKLVLGTEVLPLALEMLTETAVNSYLTKESLLAFQKNFSFASRKVEEAQDEILRVLEHDGYLKAGDEGYSFESHLLRDWWRKRYERFYVPILDREV